MARDNTVFQMGEDIGVIGGNFKCTVGLRDKYGDLRVKDTPISEQGFVGMGVGAALTGLRPVVELMFADFMMVCGDQLFNQMAKITYMSGGQCNVPMVVRLPLGGGRSSAAQHSQSIHAWAAHIPGVKVVVPSTAGECKGLLKTAIRDNDPVMFFEHKMLYTTKFNDVPEVEEDVCIPFGQARIVAEGADITVVTNSMMTIKAEKAVRQLQKGGHQRRADRPAHHRAPGHRDNHQVGEKDGQAADRRRGPPQLRHHRRDRLPDHARRVL